MQTLQAQPKQDANVLWDQLGACFSFTSLSPSSLGEWVPNILAVLNIFGPFVSENRLPFFLFPLAILSRLGHWSFGLLRYFVLTFSNLGLPCLLHVWRGLGMCYPMASQRPRDQITCGKMVCILEGCTDLSWVPFKFWNAQLESVKVYWCDDVFGLLLVVYLAWCC